MAEEILTRQADLSFTQKVVEYNNEKDRKRKEKMLPYLKEHTELLIYRICLVQLHLTKDEAADVFINMSPDVEKIIASFVVAKSTFNWYIKQICSYRCRTLRREEKAYTLCESAYFYEAEPHYMGLSPMDEEYAEMEYYAGAPDEEIEKLSWKESPYAGKDLKTIFNAVVMAEENEDVPVKTRYEGGLKKELGRMKRRHDFLIFLLYIPVAPSPVTADDCARVLGCDTALMECFFHNKKMFLDDNRTGKSEEALLLAHRHWRTMAKLRAQMYNEGNKDRCMVLAENYDAHARYHRQCLQAYRRYIRGMSQCQIAGVLGISRSAVSTSIKRMRILLEKLMREEHYIKGMERFR